MSVDDDLPEADRVDGAPHPRETVTLFGHAQAEADFLDAFNSDRLHHGWLISGAEGVGKATLAWRIARFLLATPIDDGDGLFGAPPAPTSLDISPDHPVAHRVAALSDPGLFLMRRAYDHKKKGLKTVITVDEVRRMKSFFGLSATDGGRRVAIIDSADEMNPSAANAVLKLLEEPPANTTLLLVSHQPSRLLPTIRSRCRSLRLGTLAPQDMADALHQAGVELDDHQALAALSGGSVGAAVRLANLGGEALYRDLVTMFADLPRLDRPKALAMAQSVVGKAAADRFELMLNLLDLFLSRLARSGAGALPDPQAAAGEAELMARLCPDAHSARIWAECAQELGARVRRGHAVNLDPAALILDTVLRIDQTAASLAAR